MRFKFIIPALSLLLASCATPQFIVHGKNVDPATASRLHWSVADSFSSRYTAIIQEVDGRPTPLVVGPGAHSFVLTYVRIDGPILAPGHLKPKKFKGAYLVSLETKQGKLYAPVFKSPDEGQIANEMCIVEVDQDVGGIVSMKNLKAIRLARETGNFVGCSTPTIAPESDFSICPNGADLFNC